MKLITILSIILIAFLGKVHAHNHETSIDFTENKGQWDASVKYRTSIKGGSIYIQEKGLTFDFYSLKDINRIGDKHHQKHQPDVSKEIVNCFNYKVNYIGSQIPIYQSLDKEAHYNNYILDNDPSKWTNNVGNYKTIVGKDLYPKIDVVYKSDEGNLKYDFILHPGANLANLKMEYNGTKGMSIVNGKLVIETSFDQVTEQAPYVYQVINGKKIEISADYVLTNNIISYKIGYYDKTKDLIIDPTVIASTYSGSTETIYGHTATFDDQGNIYVGGAGFSPGGLPTTVGAYQTTYGGARDMCINKYDPTGLVLIYSTYLGGTLDDYPHSLIDYNGNLCILGTSESNDYPTTVGAYDVTHNGQEDIVVSILDPTGGILNASTYIGGSSTDGQNGITPNYGDTYRGEIFTDLTGAVYVSSVSESNNFPTSVGAYQTIHGGQQDGIALKLSSDLTTLIFSTYLGGPQDDAAYGVKSDGIKTYISGTAGTSFINAAGGAFPVHNGGNEAYVISLDATGSALVDATYFGTSDDEQAFFVEIDKNNDIFILGQSDGSIAATAGVHNDGDKVFITKFNNTLTTRVFTSTTADMAPVAFLVDNCDYIYASGHGGLGGLSGFTVTTNAIQSSSAGFYLMSLNANAASLNFGTYYGTNNSHVDGGTSRFDKKGVVYQATCSDAGFPTNLGSFRRNISGSASWDMTVFKIDFEQGASPAVFGPFPNDEAFVFDANGCFDVVAFGGSPGDSVFMQINSSAFPFGAITTLPPQKLNGYYDFNYTDTTTGTSQTITDVEVYQQGPHSFVGIGRAGARFCWNVDDCDALTIDTFDVNLLSLARRCDSTLDTLERDLTIIIEKDSSNPFVPNVFSPNGDGKNDYFKLPEWEYEKCYDNLTIKIFNRWGKQVYESNDPLFRWNGDNTNGKPLEAGTYYMILEGFYGGEDVTRNIPITLFR